MQIRTVEVVKNGEDHSGRYETLAFPIWKVQRTSTKSGLSKKAPLWQLVIIRCNIVD